MLVTGENGVGKTNLLEGLHVGSQGFSPRTRAEGRLVRFGAPSSRVRLAGEEGGAAADVDVTLEPGAPKRVRLNGAPLQAAEELRIRLSALAFLPDRLAIVKGGPLVRRAYFDRMLGRLFPARASLPVEYGRALAQRNEALRRTRAGVSTRDAVRPWSERVAELGSTLDAARAELVGELGSRFAERAESLGLAGGRLGYRIEELSPETLQARLERDIARGTTGAGPHLRDFELAAGTRDLRGFGSQGEQRAAVLALVLAEADALAERRGALPLLLLDDVLSELDRGRRSTLLKSLPGRAQTVVTATSAEALPRDAAPPALVVRVRPGEARAA